MDIEAVKRIYIYIYMVFLLIPYSDHKKNTYGHGTGWQGCSISFFITWHTQAADGPSQILHGVACWPAAWILQCSHSGLTFWEKLQHCYMNHKWKISFMAIWMHMNTLTMYVCVCTLPSSIVIDIDIDICIYTPFMS